MVYMVQDFSTCVRLSQFGLCQLALRDFALCTWHKRSRTSYGQAHWSHACFWILVSHTNFLGRDRSHNLIPYKHARNISFIDAVRHVHSFHSCSVRPWSGPWITAPSYDGGLWNLNSPDTSKPLDVLGRELKRGPRFDRSTLCDAVFHRFVLLYSLFCLLTAHSSNLFPGSKFIIETCALMFENTWDKEYFESSIVGVVFGTASRTQVDKWIVEHALVLSWHQNRIYRAIVSIFSFFFDWFWEWSRGLDGLRAAYAIWNPPDPTRSPHLVALPSPKPRPAPGATPAASAAAAQMSDRVGETQGGRLPGNMRKHGYDHVWPWHGMAQYGYVWLKIMVPMTHRATELVIFRYV